MTAATGEAASRVERYLAVSGLASRHPRVTALTGDASDRRYFRVALADSPSQIVAVHANPIVLDLLPFAIVGRLLDAMPLPVPRILGHDDELGVIALEDLGDTTLQTHLSTATTAERRAKYLEAIELIAILQRRGRELRSPDLLPYQLAFDVEKLMWELRFFTQHFLEGHRQATIADEVRQALEGEFLAIAAELSSEPRVLCHRDYHSRNLMVHGGRLWIIDFQDARLGPDTYDLVSLLRDAYVDVEPGEVDDLAHAFVVATGAGTDYRADFRRRFDLMAVQRTLKALGTFGFQATSRGNPSYLQNVPRTLAVLKATLTAYPRFDRLRRQLASLVPEIA